MDAPQAAGRLGRMGAAVAVGVVGILVAASLVYVGVHYVTDVLGGLGLALAWLGVLRWWLQPAGEGV